LNLLYLGSAHVRAANNFACFVDNHGRRSRHYAHHQSGRSLVLQFYRDCIYSWLPLQCCLVY